MNSGEYWFPIDRFPHAPPPPDAEAFEAERFLDPRAQEDLRAALASLGVARLFELGEDPGTSAEIDLALLEPVYLMAERFWIPADASWVVYASHESTVTVAGAALLRALRARARP